MSLKPGSPGKAILRQMHMAQEKYLERCLDVPAHLHHTAFRMSNPAIERPQSRKEFRELLACLGIPPAQTVLEEKSGFGIKTGPDGDRLIAIWEAHTEYYSYQMWHLPGDQNQPVGIRSVGISRVCLSFFTPESAGQRPGHGDYPITDL
jgi:hypothetical protein